MPRGVTRRRLVRPAVRRDSFREESLPASLVPPRRRLNGQDPREEARNAKTGGQRCATDERNEQLSGQGDLISHERRSMRGCPPCSAGDRGGKELVESATNIGTRPRHALYRDRDYDPSGSLGSAQVLAPVDGISMMCRINDMDNGVGYFGDPTSAVLRLMCG
ncbi:hypothetical protein KM043_014851 [Ampulex compressa]|nr:hypothetical protein KM043_014851 [Ampulex compressa]